MLARIPATEKMNVSEVEGRLRDLVGEISRDDTRILVEQDGVPMAAIIPIADLRRLLRQDDQVREAFELLEAIRARFDDVPDEEIERQTERIMAEIKEENRAARERIEKSA